MKLEALFNSILQNEMLKEIETLYKDVDEVEKATIIEAIVKYLVIL